VDGTGLILTRTKNAPDIGKRLGDSGDELELRVLQDMMKEPSGAPIGSGAAPPDRVAGFYRLKRAPWTLVIIAPGDKMLWPIIRYLRIYVIASSVCVFLVLLLIRLVTGKVATSVRTTCQAARRVAQGDYDVVVPEPNTNDEFQRLAESFNTMVEGLKEKEFIRDTFGRYIDKEGGPPADEQAGGHPPGRTEALGGGDDERCTRVYGHLRELQSGADYLHRQPAICRAS
jgi:adenylate cyclase